MKANTSHQTGTVSSSAKGMVVSILIGVGLPAGLAPGQCPPRYEISVIQGPEDPFWGFPVIYGSGLNELGHVVGDYSYTVGGAVAFFWSPQTGLVTLATPPGFSEAAALDINDQGEIVGAIFHQATQRYHAALWINGVAQDLGIPPGGNYSTARAINNATQVVGVWGNDISGPALVAFIWQGGVMSPLELPMGPNSEALGVNEDGQVVGWMGPSPVTDAHAYIWDAGDVTDLGVLPPGRSARARAINETGEVVGAGLIPQAGFPFGVSRAVLWQGGKTMNLGTLPGFIQSAATDVNNSSQIVGLSRDFDGNPNFSRAFIWQDGSMLDLSDLIPPDSGFTITAAWAINDAGQISARADAYTVALLTPVAPPVGDLNCDGLVDVLDLLSLLASWGPCEGCTADLNIDGTVDLSDLLLLFANWG